VEFEFGEDQRLLQQVVRETVARSRSLPAEQLWQTYQDLGWLEAPPVELAIVLEELGYAADPTPFLATATWFAPLAGRWQRTLFDAGSLLPGQRPNTGGATPRCRSSSPTWRN
jgi:hypothetical protein